MGVRIHDLQIMGQHISCPLDARLNHWAIRELILIAVWEFFKDQE